LRALRRPDTLCCRHERSRRRRAPSRCGGVSRSVCPPMISCPRARYVAPWLPSRPLVRDEGQNGRPDLGRPSQHRGHYTNSKIDTGGVDELKSSGTSDCRQGCTKLQYARLHLVLKSSLDAVRLRGISKEVVGTLATGPARSICVLCREERRGTPKFLV
jgi:hypothetical protein